MSDSLIDIRIPRKFNLQVSYNEPVHISHIDLLSLAIKAKESFPEYKDIPIANIFEQFGTLIFGNDPFSCCESEK